MPPYGSVPSPSLGKMEGYGSRNESMRRRRFVVGRVVGDPFALATLSIAMLGWLIAFVGSIVSDVEKPFPHFVWWTMVYMLGIIIGIFIVYASGSVHTYHVAIVGFLSTGLVYTTAAVNQLVYAPGGAFEAAGAGFILLSMVAIIWIFYFGSQAQASHRVFVDSFALYKQSPSPRGSRQMSSRYMEPNGAAYNQNTAPRGYAPNALSGFETSSLPHEYSGNVAGQNTVGPFSASNPQSPAGATQYQSHGNLDSSQGNEVAEATEYPHKARAIYSYEANPDDPTEISFSKHEELEISDVSGKWWQARKKTGETGIAPSNYLILL